MLQFKVIAKLVCKN